ncbi:MAG: hypothetical protein R3F56_26205 [Planctomycetota bacterium]
MPLLALLILAAPQDPVATFTEHVAPIVFANCVKCHREGEVAPFPLTSYHDVRKRGKMIARVTARRYMPPWHPVEGHGDFAGAMRLSDDEIETIARWVDQGMPEGDPHQLPTLPAFTPGWQLGEPDLVVKMTEGFPVPAGGADIYRSFAIPLQFDGDRWVTAIEVRPSARSVLHHIVFALDTSGSARRAEGEDGKPGFDGMRRVASGFGGWAVGGMPQHLPQGLAVRLPKGADLVLNSHFHPSGKAETEQTTLGLYFAKEPPTRSLVTLQLPPRFGVAAGLDVPAGKRDFELEDSFTLPVAAEAVTVGGHAHMICAEMQVFVTPPGEERRSIFWIDDWDFDWQNRYQYRTPVALPKGTLVEVRIRYDNSADNPDNPFDPPRRIRWGLQSTDEMGSVSLLLVAKDEAEAPALRRAIQAHARAALRAGGASTVLAGVLTRIRMADRDGDGIVAIADLPARLQTVARRADTNGDGNLDDAEIEAATEAFERRR